MPEEPEVIEEAIEEGKGKSKLLPILVALVCLGAGGAAGAKGLGGPVGAMLADRAAPSAEAEGGEGGHGGEAADAEPAALHVVDNLVVNPAGSGGGRFLLTSIALEAASTEATDLLSAHDLELRDALLLVLGSKTVEELTDISKRSSISDELRSAVDRVVGPGVVERLFIPQFVIQ